jgi:superfamily II DNA or RNA helicase
MTSLAALRPHQAKALDDLRDALRSGSRRPVLQAPCGFGKTVVAAHIVAGCRQRGKRVAFCVPTLTLIDQTFDRFVENGIDAADMGVLQGDHPWRRPHAPIQIATAQTLARRDFPITDFVVVDECHVQFGVYDRWMAESAATFIGLTATPWARGMGAKWDRLIKTTSLVELIGLGYLSPFRVFAPSHPDLVGVSTVAGDYHEGELAERMNKPKLVADIVQTWIDRGEDRPTLCFATGREHAKSIRDRFREFGVPVAYVDADTPRDERDVIGRMLASGEVKVVCNIGCLTTGIDWDVRCLILARPTKSEILFVQIVGRGLRTADGKDTCLILDHSDTHERLGLVTEIDHDELDDGKKRKSKSDRKERKLPLPKCCTHCTALMPAHENVCLECGTPLPRRVDVEVVDGELREFGGRKDKPKQKRGELAELPKADVYGQLLSISIERGRSSGWVAYTYRDIFGVWPRGVDGAQPQEPSYAVRQFVRHKDIRWAKSRRNVEVVDGAA